jgi:hypothetical protein
MAKHTRKKKSFDEAEELSDPRPQPQISAADFTDETVPQQPPPREKTPVREDNDKEAG